MKYIATYEGYAGEGNTLDDAYADLQAITEPESFEFISFYEAKEIKVIQELKVVPTITKSKITTTKE